MFASQHITEFNPFYMHVTQMNIQDPVYHGLTCILLPAMIIVFWVLIFHESTKN